MLSKCVNPSCSTSFKHLREGRLLRVDKPKAEEPPATGKPLRKNPKSARSSEYYWLCGSCSQRWNLVFDHGAGIVLIPMAGRAAVA